MRPTRFVLFLMSNFGNEYRRLDDAIFNSVAEACTAGFLAHCKKGGGNRPYLVLPETTVGPLESLDADFARTETELHQTVAEDGSVILSMQELRSYLLNHGPELDTAGFAYLVFAQSYGADNCHEMHETRYGCDCWVGMTEEDVGMLLDEVSENTSTYPAFKLVVRASQNMAVSGRDHDWFPSGLSSAMSKLSHVIDAKRLNGESLPEAHLDFLREVLEDLEVTAAMYED